MVSANDGPSTISQSSDSEVPRFGGGMQLRQLGTSGGRGRSGADTDSQTTWTSSTSTRLPHPPFLEYSAVGLKWPVNSLGFQCLRTTPLGSCLLPLGRRTPPNQTRPQILILPLQLNQVPRREEVRCVDIFYHRLTCTIRLSTLI